MHSLCARLDARACSRPPPSQTGLASDDAAWMTQLGLGPQDFESAGGGQERITVAPLGYDSVVAAGNTNGGHVSTLHHNEYLLYGPRANVLPIFVVKFRHTESCSSRECASAPSAPPS